ncbi:arylamine N-acetyltransferase [Pseudogracilibacillus auburnensis]|uniref:arylamine N-acetyltransferase n=1 Tax=Pseudogracilibacillus auburnensis TaxID=1494959 RepID=UPI001A95BF4F|nr:arylamine N-acetyltransferase [Pseudogracilibacillus auburnensis]MBO1002616.1 arylamine N-acetyltransferase [Pseudogracilibacillus auburnensis]
MGNQNFVDYLRFLNLDIEARTLSYLKKICKAQLNTFPFENISKLIYFQKGNFKQCKVPEHDTFIENFNKYNFGGTCYTLNSHLNIFLKQLGFISNLTKVGNQHMGIIVKLNGDKYYVDIGAAAPLFSPLLLQNKDNYDTNFGNDRIHIVNKNDGTYDYIRLTDGKKSGETWSFNPSNSNNIFDFHSLIDKSNEPGSTFMTILRCQLYQLKKRRSVSLVNNRFTIRYTNGRKSVTTLSSQTEIVEVITEEFGLTKLPIHKAIDVLNQLNIDIFSKSS